jgi:hypothetical protein
VNLNGLKHLWRLREADLQRHGPNCKADFFIRPPGLRGALICASLSSQLTHGGKLQFLSAAAQFFDRASEIHRPQTLLALIL